MTFSTVCTMLLFTAISFGIQIFNWYIMSKSGDDDWLLIGIIIFLWNVMAPVFLVYRLLVERGML